MNQERVGRWDKHLGGIAFFLSFFLLNKYIHM